MNLDDQEINFEIGIHSLNVGQTNTYLQYETANHIQNKIILIQIYVHRKSVKRNKYVK